MKDLIYGLVALNLIQCICWIYLILVVVQS